MSMRDYIMNDVKILDIDQNIGELKKLFNELTYTHLPVAENGVYLGCISENDTRCFEGNKAISDYRYALEGFFTRDTDYWLESLESFAKNDANILPVLDQDNNYLGYVELNDVISHFKETPFIHDQGNILVLEKHFKEFTFSEISQIVESNNNHLLGAFVSEMDEDKAQITIKVTTSGINELIQSFRRYGYIIVSQHQEDSFRENMKERSKYLDKYLNI